MIARKKVYGPSETNIRHNAYISSHLELYRGKKREMLAQRQTEQSLSCAHFSKPEPFRVELNIAKKTITHETFLNKELLYPDFL